MTYEPTTDGSTLVTEFHNGTTVRKLDGAFLVYGPTGNLAGASRLFKTAFAAAEALSKLAASA